MQSLQSKKTWIIIIIFVFTISSIVLMRIENKGIFSYNALVIVGDSMEPSIHKGSMVIAKKMNDSDLQIGDVISFYGNRQIITHRITNMMNGTERNYVTRGDANNGDDVTMITSKDIIGKVNIVIPYLGYIALFVSSKIGLLVLIIIPSLLIIVAEVYKLIRQLLKGKLVSEI